jgi:hypothetical protein
VAAWLVRAAQPPPPKALIQKREQLRVAAPLCMAQSGESIMKDTHPQMVDRSLPELEKELSNIRQQSLIAMRRGDYRAVAKYTNDAARVNQVIAEMDDRWARPRR